MTLYGQVVSHVFNVVGSFPVDLTVRDTSSNTDPDTMIVTVLDSSVIPPTVEGQAATPDPQEFMQPVLISAWVNDTSPIATVTVRVDAPTAGMLGNFTMTLSLITAKYEYALSTYPDLGTYLFTIWATDTDGNNASGGGSFVVQDTTNPVASAGPDQVVTNGTSVSFDGGGSTDNFLVENWTWSFNDGGAVVLYGTTASHTFSASGVYTVALTVRDTTSNSDTDTMTVTVLYPPKPNPPTGVTATQTAVGTATVTWTAPTHNTNGSVITGPLTYLVYRSATPTGTYSLVSLTPVSGTQYVDSGLTPGNYYYKVEAVNQWGNHSDMSSPEAPVTITDRGRIIGLVESGGQPLAGAKVELLNSAGIPIDNATTGSDGAFSFDNLAPGAYTVRASKDGYETNQKATTATAFATTDVGIIVLTVKQAGEAGLPWMWIGIITIVIVALISVLLYMMRRRRRPAPEQAQQTPPPPPPPPPQQQPGEPRQPE